MVNLGCPKIEGVYCLCKQRFSHEKTQNDCRIAVLATRYFAIQKAG